MNQTVTSKPVAGCDLLLAHELTICKPIAEVWPHLLNLEGWMPTHRLESVAGEPGQLGEVFKVFSPADSNNAYFLLKVVKLEPPQQLILKMMSLSEADCALMENDADIFRDIIGFENMRLVDMGDHTKLIFQGAGFVKSAERTQEAMEQWTEEALTDAGNRWSTLYGPTLKRMAEGE